MNRTLIAALSGALAVLLIGVSAAQAPKLNAQSYPATVNGVQGGEHAPPPPESTTSSAYVIGFEHSLMTECKTAAFNGELATANSSMTLTPAASECAAFGVLTATVNMNGCQYRLNPLTGEAGEYSGNLDIVCPEGKRSSSAVAIAKSKSVRRAG